MADHETRTERRKKTLHRIHRIQGQLAALERDIDTDAECEALVIQASAVEKAVHSLILHMMDGYLDHQVKPLLEQDRDQALQDIKRLFELISR